MLRIDRVMREADPFACSPSSGASKRSMNESPNGKEQSMSNDPIPGDVVEYSKGPLLLFPGPLVRGQRFKVFHTKPKELYLWEREGDWYSAEHFTRIERPEDFKIGDVVTYEGTDVSLIRPGSTETEFTVEEIKYLTHSGLVSDAYRNVLCLRVAGMWSFHDARKFKIVRTAAKAEAPKDAMQTQFDEEFLNSVNLGACVEYVGPKHPHINSGSHYHVHRIYREQPIEQSRIALREIDQRRSFLLKHFVRRGLESEKSPWEEVSEIGEVVMFVGGPDVPEGHPFDTKSSYVVHDIRETLGDPKTKGIVLRGLPTAFPSTWFRRFSVHEDPFPIDVTEFVARSRVNALRFQRELSQKENPQAATSPAPLTESLQLALLRSGIDIILHTHHLALNAFPETATDGEFAHRELLSILRSLELLRGIVA